MRFGSNTSRAASLILNRPSVSTLRIKTRPFTHLPPSLFQAMSGSSSSSTGPNHIDLSLKRITTLLSRLDNPHSTFPVIHVAGTNGKGTTTVYLDEILSKVVGLRTARFNSPHLVQQRDACRINGQPVSSHIWSSSLQWVQTANERRLTGEELSELQSETSSNPTSPVPRKSSPHQSTAGESKTESEQEGPLQSTPFELQTATALLSFSLLPLGSKPEILIVEVGLGGKLDATNVFSDQQVLASVICPIDKDHQNLLGNTLSEISIQKAGTIKQNGLVVVADQRRRHGNQDPQPEEELDCTSIKSEEIERRQLGKEAAEILEAIRSVSTSRNARMVKSFIDWDILDDMESNSNLGSIGSESHEWECLISSQQRFSPTLFLPSPPPSNQGRNRSIDTGLSSLFPPARSSATSPASKVPVYKSSIGDVSIPGPSLRIPPTRASLTGSHTALQTLFSIARDEPPSAMGITGSDELEELKLKIAFALRSEGNGERRLKEVLDGGVRLEGRADWKSIIVPDEDDQIVDSKETEQVEMKDQPKEEDQEGGEAVVGMKLDGNHEQVTSDSQDQEIASTNDSMLHNHKSSPVLFLLDGAHNPSSAEALRAYIDICIASRFKSQSSDSPTGHTLTINWIIAFTKGKEVGQMLEALLQPSPTSRATQAEPSVEERIEGMDLDSDSSAKTLKNAQIQHKICFVSFKTPVEGMPWIQSLEAWKCSEALKEVEESRLKSHRQDWEKVAEVKEVGNLLEGLRWVSKREKAREKVGIEMNVICGSLYLIGEAYSL